MILLSLDVRAGLVFLPLIFAASWALFNVIFALKNNIPRALR